MRSMHTTRTKKKQKEEQFGEVKKKRFFDGNRRNTNAH